MKYPVKYVYRHKMMVGGVDMKLDCGHLHAFKRFWFVLTMNDEYITHTTTDYEYS